MRKTRFLIGTVMIGAVVLADAAAAQLRPGADADMQACAFLEGQPAVDACDDALRSRLPVEIRAEAAWKKGIELAALGEFRRIVDLIPGNAGAHYNLGLALNNVGRHADAVRAYREAVRLRPDYADAWGNLGLAAHLIGQHRASADAFVRAATLRPAYFDTRPRQYGAFEVSRDFMHDTGARE